MSAACEVIECPIAGEGRVCAPVAAVQQQAWETRSEIAGLASDLRANTSECRELRVAVGVQTRMIAERIDPILAAIQRGGSEPPTDPPPRGEMATGSFEVPAQLRIRSARRRATFGIPMAALVSAAATAAITSGLIPALCRAIVHLLGG
jgi:hypothetical protein